MSIAEALGLKPVVTTDPAKAQEVSFFPTPVLDGYEVSLGYGRDRRVIGWVMFQQRTERLEREDAGDQPEPEWLALRADRGFLWVCESRQHAVQTLRISARGW